MRGGVFMKRAGFTLIELLIVMAIIAALMAVLIPTATGAMRRARASRLAVEIRNYVSGLQQYLVATMPPTSLSGVTESQAQQMGFIDQNLANKFDANLNAEPQNSRIVISLTYDARDSSIAQLVSSSLQGVFDSVTATGATIQVTSYVQAFWW